MSRFEQRRALGVRDLLAQKKIKLPKDQNVVYLQNAGDDQGLAAQRALYWQEGYDELHRDEDGIVMVIPPHEAAANEQRYRNEANSRLERKPDRVGVPGETGNVQERTAPVSVQDFLEGTSEDD